MTQDNWIGIEHSGEQAIGWRFHRKTVLEVASSDSIAGILAQLGSAPALIVEDGSSAQPVPAPVLPESWPMPALTQDRPRGHLDPTARLRIAGTLAGRRNWDGVICLHMPSVTHWCQISADEVVSFQSALTPELAHALKAADHADADALADTMSRPERLSLHLRSAGLAGSGAAVAGHLLGAELAAMRPYWLGQQVIVVAGNSLYAHALRAQGVPTETVDPTDAARDGLIALRDKLL